jgi:hypothetical protein
VTNARACKGAGQEGSLRVTFHAPSIVGKCEGEWTLTLPSELPFWELESWWTLKFLENDRKGQNPLGWRVFYIIGKLLERRCLEWACMTHLDTSNVTHGQKKGWKSNWQFDSQPLKVKNRPNFLVCRWLVTYCWKALNKGYNFASSLISVKGLHTKLWAPKVATLGISGLESWDKMPFGC